MQRSKNYSASADGTSRVALPPNQNRVAIILSSHATERYSIAFGEPAILDTGLTMQPLTEPVILSAGILGSALADEIRIVASGAANIGIVEVGGP